MAPKQAELERLEGWIEEFQPKVYKAACLVLRDPVGAQDVAQETFLRAWNAMGRIGDDVNLERWLCRISINLCLNQLRSRRREQVAVNRLTLNEPPGDPYELESARSEMGEALRRLPDRLRVPLVLRYYLDLPESEVARALSLRVGTVKSRLHEARRSLANDASVGAAHLGG